MAHMSRIPWWQWAPIHGWRIVATVAAADEVPARLPRRGTILVGSVERPKWMAFDCPCGEGHRILINLDLAHWPRWKMSVGRKLTLWPSIDYRTATRRCHYFIREGRVNWINEKRDQHEYRKASRNS